MSSAPQDQHQRAKTAWHARSIDQTLAELETDEAGLSQTAAANRLEEYGPNEIHKGDDISPLEIFISQFKDFLIYLLVFAAVLSLAVGLLPGEAPNYVDAGLILLILFGNGIFGFVQDYRAEKAMEELRELSSPDATVLRDGVKRTIAAKDVVPGDVVVIEQGGAVPADCRLIEATNLETLEAPLTGESASVGKTTDTLDPETPLAERSNMLYMNTDAVMGRGKAVVVETGMRTEVGGIATQIHEADEGQTPFQEEVDELGRRIGYGIVGLIALVIVVQLLFTQASTIAVLLTAITLAVAAVPEGLPAVVTLTLAIGARKMVDKNALVRRLPVVESLGSVDVILTDKTGTLTENQMTVTRIAYGSDIYEVTGTGLDTDGEFHHDDVRVDPDSIDPVLRCGLLCNNAEKAPESEDQAYYGDPTEVALLVSAKKAGVEQTGVRVREIPFSSERKRMTVVVEEDGAHTSYTKGAPETVLERCNRVAVNGEIQELTDEKRAEIIDTTESFAGDALRVLGFARKAVDDPDADESVLEEELVFLGLQGMIDVPREEVDQAVSDCRDAGIRVVMVTGDNLQTAKAIGAQIGFDPTGAMTGTEVEKLSDQELRDVVEDVEVFARAAPDHKVRILKALQANDHRVAMTGDGVNDAPGVRNADVGIAMGIRGTDVTKSASDMVLQDDNFVTIRDAIAEGRGIFDNIRKFVNLLLSANAGEVLTVFVGVLIGSALFPELFAAQSEALILTPVMLLWINLVTDGLPALALGVDPKAPNVLERSPRSTDDPVIDTRVMVSILTIGVTVTIAGLLVFFQTLGTTESLVSAQTLLFTFFVVAEMGIIQVIRRRFGQPLFSNRWLIGAVVLSLVLQLLVLYTPVADLFGVYALGLAEWGYLIAAVLAVLIANYVLSLVYDRFL
ncbi:MULTISPECIES: cation-translocating P-type ATPase [Haloferax]|uniref:HAD-IC family P-type ATPase n=2 Tax=Haloferax TaxID=2251 RepID=A0A6G1Z6C0_9EURY|nr:MULTISPECIES: cation-translocating P-type ATPase [Haloferax]KAB1185399.1 cation-translocating P-type ATPase [Haloferax sp. CBA1149]MRW82043.1 HAD-IC family P-type ATPase [Haloferax marinisediminis]